MCAVVDVTGERGVGVGDASEPVVPDVVPDVAEAVESVVGNVVLPASASMVSIGTTTDVGRSATLLRTDPTAAVAINTPASVANSHAMNNPVLRLMCT